MDAQHVFSQSAVVMQVDKKLTKIGPFLGIVGHRKGGDRLTHQYLFSSMKSLSGDGLFFPEGSVEGMKQKEFI